MTDQEKLKQFLTEQDYMVLAVTLDDGSPWAVPVKMQLQQGNVFEWDSMKNTEHSKAIEARPEIAITVFDKTGETQFGFYAKAMAKCIETKEHGLGRYQAVVREAWINDETFHKRQVEMPEAPVG